MKRISVAFAFCMSLSLPVSAQDLQKGLPAYDAGFFTTHLKEFKSLAEAGDAQAQTLLGFIYEFGEGAPQDYKEAVKWYRIAAEQGDPSAQSSLGDIYRKGIGALQNNIISHMWYNIGAANGDEGSAADRDRLAKEMTTASIEKAQAMARECMNSGYKKCEY